MVTTDAPAPLRDVIEESLDEAVFLWGRWDAELSSLTRSLDDVFSWTEDRLHGALDGVLVAGNVIASIVSDGLASDDVHQVGVCAGLLAAAPQPEALAVLTGALRDAPAGRLNAAARGLELLGSHKALNAAAGILRSGGPTHRAVLSRLKAFHRSAPREELTEAFDSDAVDWQVQVLRNARLLESDVLAPWCVRGLESPDPAVQHAAVETGIAKGLPQAWRGALARAGSRNRDAAPYLRFLALFGGAAEHEIVFDALRVPDLQLEAMWAVGHIGTSRAAETCLASMRDDTLARAAGEAYCWITGADLVRDRLTAAEPDEEVPEFENDNLDANLVSPPREAWPLPDTDAVGRDWATRKAAMATNVRHVLGHPVTLRSLAAVVETAPMLRRPDVILQLSAKTRGRYDVEPRAFAARQRLMMRDGRSVLGSGAVS